MFSPMKAGVVASALTALVLSCGGRERPPENPTQGPASGGRGPDVLPGLPAPTPAPGTEPAPTPGGPDTTPTSSSGGDLPANGTTPNGAISWRELRSPLIAVGPGLPSAPRFGSADVGRGGSGAASGSPGITGGTSPTGGTPSTGGTSLTGGRAIGTANSR
jgi:hypothetical protein